MAKGNLDDLIELSKKIEIKRKSKEDAEREEFKKKNHCMNCKFFDTKEYFAPPPKWIYYYNKSDDKDIFKEMKSKEDCKLFERKEECI